MRHLARTWSRYRRQNRFLIVTFVFLLILSLGAFYLLERTQVASPKELTNRLLLFILWYLDISLILILSFILTRNIIRLVEERRHGVLGSRFRTKLVSTYVILTFVPVLMIFLIATNLLQKSMDRWFSSPVEEILRGGAEITVGMRELVEDRLQAQATIAADELSSDARPDRLPELQRMMGVDLIALFRGSRLVEAVTDARKIPGSVPLLRWNTLPPSGVRADRWRGGLLIRSWSPIGDGDQHVVVGAMIPRTLLHQLERANDAHATFQEMKQQRGTVTATTVLVLLAVTLLLLFATVWIGLYLSRRFTEPLLAVAEATQRVAEGNQLQEVSVPASDEVGVLVHSFNAMVRRVRSTEDEIIASNQELATLLETIPTGVLTLSSDSHRFRPNPAAAEMLGEPSWQGHWHSVHELHRSQLSNLHTMLMPGQSLDSRTQLDIESGAGIRHIDVTVTPLAGGGAVVAMDDLTQLVHAERQAAWSEVARHIAHEIRNPLTPIQLSAERIQRHTSHLDGKVQKVVSSGCEAIVAHVAGLKELVDSFYNYARMPSVNLKITPLKRLLREVSNLYEEVQEGIEIKLVLPLQDFDVMVDPVLLRQALVNLLDNAIEAMCKSGVILLSANIDNLDLDLLVKDSGSGLPTDDVSILTKPFYSTKGRGSGMGLALVHRIVTEHGGTLDIAKRSSGGTSVRIHLPKAIVANVGSPR